MRCGIEFEYLLVDDAGPTPGRIRDFTNLPYDEIHNLLADKPGRDDPSLATGDAGIRSGYWYLEGDERFDETGRFREMAVKGVEIRTPPASDIAAALAKLLEIEAQLATILKRGGLTLAIVGFNPQQAHYDFVPPLNPWELHLRQTDPSYADDATPVTNLTYGPDINLSDPGWDAERCLDMARKLNRYAPYIVPFSFSSPFYQGHIWQGFSKRTYERSPVRPAVKFFVAAEEVPKLADRSRLVHAARVPQEVGRVEFKAFDAHPSLAVLAACCHLLEGICLAEDLTERSEQPDVALYQRAARAAFADAAIRAGAGEVLGKASAALARKGDKAALAALAPLQGMFAERRTPAHELLVTYQSTGRMYKLGGHNNSGLQAFQRS